MTKEGATMVPAGDGKDSEPVPPEFLRDGSVVFNEWADFAAAVLKGALEGETWVGLENSYYTKPEVTAKTLLDISKNNYITEQLKKLRGLLFTERPEFQVLDSTLPEDDEKAVDEELSDQLAEMMNAKNVRAYRVMQQVWTDIRTWGCSLWNPVYKREGNRADLVRMRRLPPESFDTGGLTHGKPGKVYSQILRGITLAEDGETIEYWQRQSGGAAPVQVKNVIMFKDPISTELAGTSELLPLVPIVGALNFTIKAQMQYVNRTGAPYAYIRFIKPPAPKTADRDDIALAKKVIQNWGKDSAYMLKDNMELQVIDIKGRGNPLDTIEYFEKRIRTYWSPSTIIATEGPTLGEGTSAKLDLVHEWLKGEHEWLETEFEELGNQWLEWNGYTDRVTSINIPEPEPDNTKANLEKATVGFNTRSNTVNERRKLLGEEEFDLESEEGKAKMEALRGEYASQQPPSPFGGGGFPFRPPSVPGEENGEGAAFQQAYMPDPELTVELERAAKTAEDRVMAALASALEEAEQP